MKVSFLTRFLLLLSFHHLVFPIYCNASQTDNLSELLESRKSQNPPNTELWVGLHNDDSNYSPVYIGPQDGLKEADKMDAFPVCWLYYRRPECWERTVLLLCGVTSEFYNKPSRLVVKWR